MISSTFLLLFRNKSKYKMNMQLNPYGLLLLFISFRSLLLKNNNKN